MMKSIWSARMPNRRFRSVSRRGMGGRSGCWEETSTGDDTIQEKGEDGQDQRKNSWLIMDSRVVG